VRAEEQLARLRLVVTDDDGLSPAEVETRHGVLVRHAPGETQCIDDGFVVGCVAPEARSTKRGAKDGAVNGDDAAIPGSGIVAEHDLLVPHARYGVEYLH
jgi:hypothetical protein